MFLLLQILVWIFYETAADLHVTGPFDPIMGVVGDDVILDCVLITAVVPENIEVRWINMEYGYNSPIHMYTGRADDLTFQPSTYNGRTEMFLDEVAQGNLSLRLKDVRVSDRGQYQCFVVSNDKHSDIAVTLNVTGMGQQPWIEMESQMGNSIRLGCRSEGWYPEPPILWVNGDGVNMTAQQETTYQPDNQGLFIVSSSIEISMQSLNKYTCLIHNVILKESREAHIQIADVFFSKAELSVLFWINISMIAVLPLFLSCWCFRHFNSIKENFKRARKSAKKKKAKEAKKLKAKEAKKLKAKEEVTDPNVVIALN